MDYWRFLGMPEDWSEHGYQIDSIIFWMHVLMLALFVGWGLFFVFTLIRFSRLVNRKANYHGVKSHVSRYLEVAVAVAEVILLIGFSIPVWAQAIAYPEDRRAAEPPYNIRVHAQQFAWGFHYPGPDGEFGRTDGKFIEAGVDDIGLDQSDPRGKDDLIVTKNLHVPVSVPIAMKLTSKDVIHSFSIPTLRVKTDTIPGVMSTLWFKALPQEAGPSDGTPLVSDIACAQLCGVQHSVMKGEVTIEIEKDFNAWYRTQLAMYHESLGKEPPVQVPDHNFRPVTP